MSPSEKKEVKRLEEEAKRLRANLDPSQDLVTPIMEGGKPVPINPDAPGPAKRQSSEG